MKTWSLLQEKQSEYLLKLDQEMYDNEISWIDEPDNRFHALRSKKRHLDILLKDEKMKREEEELDNKTIELAESDELKRQDEKKRQLENRKKSTRLKSIDYTTFVNHLKTYKSYRTSFEKRQIRLR